MARGDIRAARRYAKALFNAALAANQVEAAGAGLSEVTSAAAGSPQLMTVLRHPLISRERKTEILRTLFESSLPPLVEHFLFLLVEKDRAGMIDTVSEEFARLVDEHQGIANAEAVTAVAMGEGERDALLQQLQTATGKTIRLTTRVDEELLGGLVVRVGDRMIDGSVASQLQRMRESLKQVKVS